MVEVEEIRTRARELLESGKVRAVLGYRRGAVGAMAEPAFITTPAEAASLVWDPTCMHNLALYLVNEKKRQAHERAPDRRPLAVVAKGCDSRAITVLLQENHFRREDVVILGVSCESSGMVDPRKLHRLLEGRAPASVAFAQDGAIAVGDRTLAAAEVLAERCLECSAAHPVLGDAVFGDRAAERALTPRFSAVEAAAARPLEERWAFWGDHFERCIRCFACRSVCPMCYCDECVVDSISFIIAPETTAEEKANRIRWIERSPSSSENAMYHLVRAMHLAGRCIDCGECERVCPVNIPIRLLNTLLEKEALEMFEYVPGMDPAGASLLSSFRDGDPDDFIR